MTAGTRVGVVQLYDPPTRTVRLFGYGVLTDHDTVLMDNSNIEITRDEAWWCFEDQVKYWLAIKDYNVIHVDITEIRGIRRQRECRESLNLVIA
jgi:hypothetical protein